MIYTHLDVEPRTQVWDVDLRARLEQVKALDTGTGEVVVYVTPLTVDAAGTASVTETLRFRSIYPIYGGYYRPCLFHCYGRLPE